VKLFRFGKRTGAQHVTAEQREIIERFEKGEISADEAGKLLGATVRTTTIRLGDDAGISVESTDTPTDDAPTETPEEAQARELVERLAREVYGDEHG
jgi:hypothetical protein